MISRLDFEKLELRIGTILNAGEFPEARKPAYKLTVDLGPEIGLKHSSAQITAIYNIKQLIGRQVVCVCNLPPKQVGPFTSEVLLLGSMNESGEVILLHPDHPVPNGAKVY